jgi:large repetitive protein
MPTQEIMMGESSAQSRSRGFKAWLCGVVVVATALSGVAAGAASATAPGAPTIKSVKPTGKRAVLVTIGKPADDGGARISSYRVTCTSSNGGVTGAHSAPTSPVTVPALTAGKTYRCTAVASNNVGFGPASAASSAVIPRPTPPGPPTITAVKAVSLRTIQVMFKKPTNNGGAAISNYRATCTSSNGGTSRTRQAAGSPISVTGLTASDTYTCTVAAGNNVGLGTPSKPSAKVIPRPTPPGAPTINSAHAVGQRSVSVAFTNPADNGGAPITSNLVSCTSKNGGVGRNRVAGSSPIRVSGMTAGKIYTCTVQASNGVRRGPPSAPSKPVVPRAH